jgi:hypothetical protein
MLHYLLLRGRERLVATDETESILRALAEAGDQSPDLKDYYEFHRAVLGILNEARAEVSDVRYPDIEELAAVEVSQGPMLRFESLPIEGERFARLVVAVGRALTDYDPSIHDQDVPATPVVCLRLARQRFEEGQACGRQGRPGDDPTLAQLCVDLALRPYLEWGAEQLTAHIHVQTAWRQGCCPVCGGGPDFASLGEESGARHLICSRCNAQWPYPRFGCPFCGNQDHTTLSYHLSEDSVYRLYLCQECRRYLKTIDLRQVHRLVLLPLERITTSAMDVAALEAGYR